MADVAVTSLHQKAVLWTITGYDGNGDVTLSAPIQIKAHYEISLSSVNAPEKSPTGKSVEVWVDRIIPLNSQMWLGALADLPSPVKSGLYSVTSFSDIPDIKGRKHEYSVSLVRSL